MRVAIVDDDAITRVALVQSLGAQPGLNIAWDAASGEEALDRARAEREADFLEGPRAEVVLVDLNMPGLDGIETIRGLCGFGDPPRCVAFSSADTLANIQAALLAGARGYLVKHDDLGFIVEALGRVLAGEQMVFSSTCSSRLLEGLAQVSFAPKVPAPPTVILNETELKILRGIAQSWTNKQIAARVGLSYDSVRARVKVILAKLDVADRSGAVAVGFQTGLLP